MDRELRDWLNDNLIPLIDRRIALFYIRERGSKDISGLLKYIDDEYNDTGKDFRNMTIYRLFGEGLYNQNPDDNESLNL